MIPIMEFQKRALQGPVMKATQFDINFSKTIRELVAKHEIAYTPEEVIVDDATADAIFHAGVELLARLGLYHLDTQRVIEFDEQEIRQVAAEYKAKSPEPMFGQGRDQIRVRFRTSEDKTPPLLAAGAAGLIEQAWFVPYIQSFAQEPTNRALGLSGGITAVDGVVPKVGTLSEMFCAQWESETLLEILRRVGRPGMHLGLLCTASSIGAIMACMRPGLRNATNTQIGIHIIPEQKLDWSRLMLAKYCEDTGITPWTSCVSVMGALCRDAADVAVGLVANLLGQLCYGHGSMSNLFTNHLDGSWADRASLWAFSGACRASERNIRVPIAGVCAGRPGAEGTPSAILLNAATSIANTGSGFSYAWIGGGSGLEARMIGEIMNGVAGMRREAVNALLNRLLPAAEKAFAEQAPTHLFPERYDLQKIQPQAWYQAMCMQGKEVLATLGVPFA